MHKKVLFAILSVVMPLVGSATMAKWLVYPEYQSIEFLDNGLIDVSKDFKYGLLDQKGKVVVPVEYDKIMPFIENLALLYKDNKFVGFTDRKGKIVDLANRDYKVAYPDLGFSEGYLVVIKDSEYYFIDTEGNEAYGPYANAYPFFNNMASVLSFSNTKKKYENMYNGYLTSTGSMAYFPKINNNDISFLSSFHDGYAIAVIKKKFYTISAEDLTNMVPFEVLTEKKPIPVTIKDKELVVEEMNRGYQIDAKNGVFNFDKYMRPVSYRLSGGDLVTFEYNNPVEKQYESNFSKSSDGEKIGLKYFDKEVLPPQLDQVRSMRGDLAVVGLNGKYGIITIDKDNDFVLKLNNNEHIGFAHKYFDSEVSLTLPTFIKCSSASIVSLSPDCEINKETRKDNETMEGHYLNYDCRLLIPKDLQHELSNKVYKFAVKYDGLVSPEIEVPVTEWYVRLYEVEMPGTEYDLTEKEPIDVDFEVTTSDTDNNAYYRTVEVVTGNVLYHIPLKRISENHYVLSLQYPDFDYEANPLTFEITVTESGCPTIRYKYEVDFEKSNNKKSNNLKVTIRPVH